MKAVILAAGVASRLRPLTDDIPKCLLKIGEQTILGQIIDNLISNNINNIVIVTGYLEEKIKTYISAKYPGLKVTYIYNKIYDSTNNIYSLWLAKETVQDDSMLLLDSDILFDKKIVGLLLDSKHENCLALKSGFQLGEEEIKVRVNGQGYITEISKEVDLKAAIGESIGIEKFTGQVLAQLFHVLDRLITVDKEVNLWYESAFQEIIDNGAQIAPVDVGSLVCIEIDTFEDIEYAGEKVVPFLNKP
jgi:choline kinase